MNKNLRRHFALLLTIGGLITLGVLYTLSVNNHMVLWYGQHAFVVNRAVHPLFFAIAAVLIAIICVVMLSGGIICYFRSDKRVSTVQTDASESKHRHGWTIVNVFLILIGFWVGFSRMAPERLAATNPDLFFSVALLVVVPVFVLGRLWLAAKAGVAFARPSFHRSPLLFRSDPLQFLFIGTFILLTSAIGSTLRLAGSGTIGFWTVVSQWSLLASWLLGELAGYVIYKERIQNDAASREG